MDGPPSYLQCHVHPSIEDCLEHALSREPVVVFQSQRMIRCLQRFITRCTLPERELLRIVSPKSQLRPLAPKQAQPHAEAFSGQPGDLQGTSDAETSRNAALGSAQPAPRSQAPQNPTPQPLSSQIPGQRPPASQNPVVQPPASVQRRGKPNESNRKRKRGHRASATTIASNGTEQSESNGDLSVESTDTENESVSSRRRRNPSSSLGSPREGLKNIDSHEENTYFQGYDIPRIKEALDAFSPGKSCEAIKLPSPGDLRKVTLAPDIPPITMKNRVERHIYILKCLRSKSEETKMIMAIFDRIWVLLVQFEVNMLEIHLNSELTVGHTRRTHAKTRFAELWGQSIIWLTHELKKANKFMILLEAQPRYISELKHDRASKWFRLRNDEARAIIRYFQETNAQKSPNYQEQNFLICKRIIECLCLLDWTLPEIAKSRTRLLAVLDKYVDLDALSRGEIREKEARSWAFDDGGWSAIASGFDFGDLEGSFTFNPDDLQDLFDPADGALFGGDSQFIFDPNALTDIFNPAEGNLL